MRTRIPLIALIVLFVAGFALAEAGGQAQDTKTINGSVQRFVDCEDTYKFYGRANQVLWADVDGWRYRHNRNVPPFERDRGYCLEVVDPAGKTVCFADGDNSLAAFWADEEGVGGVDPALSCPLRDNGYYELRISFVDRRCGDQFYDTCDREERGPALPLDEEFAPPPFTYLLHVALRDQAMEGFIQGAISGSRNKF